MMPGSNKTVWLLLFTVLFGHAVLASVLTEGRTRTGLVRTLMLDGLAPIEKLIDVSINGSITAWNNYVALLNTSRENEALRAENAELRMEIDRNRTEVNEAARLREFFDLGPHIVGDRILARVTAGDATISRQMILINKGTVNGLHVNAACITPDGVVGRVVHTGHMSAIVQLISDPDSAVGVTVETSRVQGIVRGANNGSLRLEHVDESMELDVGDRLVTSGTDLIYPKGLPFGQVVGLGPVAALMKTAVVRPAADLGRLEEVVCLINAAGATLLMDPGLALPATP